MIDNTRDVLFHAAVHSNSRSLTPPSHQCPSVHQEVCGGREAPGVRQPGDGARAYRQETHRRKHIRKPKLAAIKRFVCSSVADCRLSRGVTKLWERVRKARRTRQVVFMGGAPCVRPPRRCWLPSVRPTPEAKARTRARARTVARATVRATPAAHSQTSTVRCRASASSFLARRASGHGRPATRARDAGSRTRVRLLRARVARGDDTHPSPRARPRLRRPAPPQPAAPDRKRPASYLTVALSHITDPRNDRKRDRDARRGSAVVTGFSRSRWRTRLRRISRR